MRRTARSAASVAGQERLVPSCKIQHGTGQLHAPLQFRIIRQHPFGTRPRIDDQIGVLYHTEQLQT